MLSQFFFFCAIALSNLEQKKDRLFMFNQSDRELRELTLKNRPIYSLSRDLPDLRFVQTPPAKRSVLPITESASVSQGTAVAVA